MSSGNSPTPTILVKESWYQYFSKIDYAFIAYIFLCAVLGLTTVVRLLQTGRLWSSVLCGILFILIFVFFGRRWFYNNRFAGTYSGVWPPLINTCPDYLVYFNRSGVDTCVDLIGVNRSGGSLRSWGRGDTPENPPVDAAKYFNYIYKPTMTQDELQNLCDVAQKAGLTWEGITNGDSCTFGTPSTVIGPNSGPSSCPPARR
jgi:hypothetical protein